MLMLGRHAMRPRALPSRPTIRVVHPAGSISEHLANLHKGIEQLEGLGCEVRWDIRRGGSRWRDYYAGDDNVRAREFIDALEEPDVDIIWFARGGSGTGRIVSTICDAATQVAPRIVVGFSDATAVLNALTQHVGWVTYHGPVITSLGGSAVQTDAESCLRLLSGEINSVQFASGFGPDLEGILLGGNLTVLASNVGNPTGVIGCEKSVWLVEDVGEAPYRLERCLWQLHAAGVFKSANGIWCGDLDLSTEESMTMAERFAEDARVKYSVGAPAGHRGQLALCPLGLHVRIEAKSGRLCSTDLWVDAS